MGISQIRHRPRELPFAFLLEATITTISVLLSGDGFVNQSGKFLPDIYETNNIKLKLSGFTVCFFLLAIYYCNPLTLLCGRKCCSPYQDQDGTLHRTKLYQMGYPYNWEPLNFLKAAMMASCCAFAGFELISFNMMYPAGNEDDKIPSKLFKKLVTLNRDPVELWAFSCCGIVAFYLLCFILRLCVYCKDRKATRLAEENSNVTQGTGYGASDNAV